VGPSHPPSRHSLLLRAPGDVVGARGRVVLVDQLLHDLPGVVQLVEVVLEDVLLAELLQEGLPLAQLVVLPARPLEQLESSAASGGSRGQGARPPPAATPHRDQLLAPGWGQDRRDPRPDPSPAVARLGAAQSGGTHGGDVGVVCHHEAADAVCGRQVRGLAGQGHLDAGGTPGDEVGQLPLPDPLQTLVNLVGRERGAGGEGSPQLLLAGDSPRRVGFSTWG